MKTLQRRHRERYAINRSQFSWSIHRFQNPLCSKGPEQCTNFVLGAWIESERMRRGTAEEREAMCREFLNGEQNTLMKHNGQGSVRAQRAPIKQPKQFPASCHEYAFHVVRECVLAQKQTWKTGLTTELRS